jgi:3-(3-hydroxy-phenyl)propionate hydroxylase
MPENFEAHSENKVASCDVALVGLGPTGAVLAGLLGRRGLRVIGLERDLDVFPLPRAAHLDHQGLRALQELGCADALLTTMLRNPGLEFLGAERQLLLRLPSRPSSVSGFPASLYFHQPGFDRALRAVAAQCATVDLRFGDRVTDLDDRGDDACLTVANQAGDTYQVHAGWVVGCDGASSVVRELLEIGLEDLGFDQQWLVVDLLLPRPVPTLPSGAINFCDPKRPIVTVPIPNGRQRFELMVLPGDDLAELQQPTTVLRLLSEWIPSGAAQLERVAIYTFHGLVATSWRRGRMLLAGDAAHQMPPFLGQGMNSGLRDAVNLAWKLDHVVRGLAPAELLDSYECERKPHVRTIVRAAIEYGRITSMTDVVEAAERDRRFVDDGLLPHEKVPFSLPTLQAGPLVLDGGGELFPQPPGTAGQRLDDHIGQRFLVLARDEDALGASSGWWRERVHAYVTTLAGFAREANTLRIWLDKRDADVVVVRPDRYVLGTASNLDAITSAVRAQLDLRGLEGLTGEQLLGLQAAR